MTICKGVVLERIPRVVTGEAPKKLVKLRPSPREYERAPLDSFENRRVRKVKM